MRGLSNGVGLLLLLSVCSSCTGSAGSVPSEVGSPSVLRDFSLAAARAEAFSDPVRRCLSYPDLPGNEWSPGSAKARCRLLEKRLPSLQEMSLWLQRPNGGALLDQAYAGLLDEHYANPAKREAVFLAYEVFDSSDEARRIADSWLAKSPESAFAHAALGKQRLAAAWRARGSRFVADTATTNIESMHEFLDEALPAFVAALKINQRLSPACWGMVGIGQLSGNSEILDRGVADCGKVDPAEWYVLQARADAAQPKWGGSSRQVEDVVNDARKHVNDNPILGSLFARDVGLTPMMLAEQKQWKSAMTGLEAAAMAAPDPDFLGQAGIAAHKLGNHAEAERYLSQAIRFAPQGDRYLQLRATARNQLGDYSGAALDAKRAVEIGGDSYSYSALAMAEEKLGHRDQARDAYAMAAKDPGQRLWALKHRCQLDIVPQIADIDALACTSALITEFPDDAESTFMRAWVLRSTGHPDTAVESRFFALADTGNARQAAMVGELRGLMAKR